MITSVVRANSIYHYRNLLYISEGKMQKMKTTTDMLSIMVLMYGIESL